VVSGPESKFYYRQVEQVWLAQLPQEEELEVEVAEVESEAKPKRDIILSTSAL